MPDRRCVVYKTPLFRIVETGIILTIATMSAVVWREIFPGISASYLIVGALAFGFLLVPQIGSAIAERLGAPMMTRDERIKRYLREITPGGLYGRMGAIPVVNPNHRRHTSSRSMRRR